jgi:DNA modification methylase
MESNMAKKPASPPTDNAHPSQAGAVSPAFQIVETPVKSLTPASFNPRRISRSRLEALQASLQQERAMLQVRPIVATRDGTVLLGNQRVRAAAALGWSTIPTAFVDVGPLQAREWLLRDNNLFGEWDEDALASLLQELQEHGSSLDTLGFEESYLERLLTSVAGSPASGVDDADLTPPFTPISNRGDLFILGKHRLLCGDSTDPDDVARLMGEERAGLFATDPPYFVDYDGADRKAEPRTRQRRPTTNWWDQFPGEDAAISFYVTYLSLGLGHCVDNVPVYQFHAFRRQSLVEQAWRQAGLTVHQQLIWAKDRGTFGRSWYSWAHELAFFGWRPGHTPRRTTDDFSATTVWSIPNARPGKDVDHPTSKPVELFAIPMLQHTVRGDVCLEPFAGSGSQIVAAEQLGRRCYAIELDPAYVDVCVRRWETLTGLHGERQ